MPKNPEYDILNSFVLRQPLMPVSLFLDLISDEPMVLEKDIKSILKEPIIREALFLASPSFWNRIEKWESDEINNEKENEKIRLSILKYIARFCTRATPFGLFGSCSLEKFGSNEKLVSACRKTELDSELIGNFIQKNRKNFNNTFCSNNTIFELSDKYRYLKPIQENEKVIFVIEEVSKTEELTKILNAAKSKKNINELCDIIIKKDISVDEAKKYIRLLIKEKLLLPELQISLTNQKYLKRISSILRNKNVSKFDLLLDSLTKLDDKKFNGISDYKRIIGLLEALDFDIQLNKLFHVTSFRTKSIELVDSHKRDFKNALKIQSLLTHSFKNAKLENFETKFQKKFRSKKVKLLQALDPNYGIDYLSIKESYGFAEIFEGIDFINPGENFDVNLNPIEVKISGIIAVALQRGFKEIELQDSDFVEFKSKIKDLPDTFSGIFEIIETTIGKQVRLKNLGGSSGLNLISRFTIGDNNFKNYAKQITTIEKDLKPNQIIAELIHLPQNGLANILKRENYRDYEIPIFTNCVNEKSIFLEELSIFINEGQIILWSDHLNKEVIPRLSTAHNYHTSDLPVYRFLCDLQTQNLNYALTPNFSFLNVIFPFIPRITYKGVIISPALWKLERGCFKKLLDSNSKDLMRISKKIQDANNLPNLVLLIQRDNEMLVNLDNIDCVKYFTQLIKNQNSIVLQEFLYNLDTYKNQSQNYTNEVVVTYYKKNVR